MKVIIDLEECCGHGRCEEVASDIFEVRDDGLAHLLRTDFAEADRPLLESSVRNCPAHAIRIEN
jgi:ferredoxin